MGRSGWLPDRNDARAIPGNARDPLRSFPQPHRRDRSRSFSAHLSLGLARNRPIDGRGGSSPDRAAALRSDQALAVSSASDAGIGAGQGTMPGGRIVLDRLGAGRRLMDRVALVTGSARGIGAEIARAFHEEGARVVVTYRREEERARALARELGDALCLDCHRF